jgi:hypothetical protein
MLTKIDKDTITFISKHKLTFQQYAICLLIYHKDTASMIQIEEEIGLIGNCLLPLRTKDSNGKPQYKSELEDLIDRGYIINRGKSNKYELDYLVLTPKFTDSVLVNIHTAPKEIWNEYPRLISVEGKEFSAKSCDFDEFCDLYLKAINWDISEHQRVKEAVKTIKEQGGNYAKMGIKKWVGSRQWDEMELTVKPKIRMR